MRTKRLPSEKRSTSLSPGCTRKYSQILSVSFGLPLPLKMRISSAVIVPSRSQRRLSASRLNFIIGCAANSRFESRFISAEAELAPGSALPDAALTDFAFNFAIDFDAGRIHHQAPRLGPILTDPGGATSPLFKRGVILAPVADAISGLLFHGRKSIPRHGIRNASFGKAPSYLNSTWR